MRESVGDRLLSAATMEDVSGAMTITEGEPGLGLSEDGGLTFPMVEEDSTLTEFAYIIHLPVPDHSVPEPILADSVHDYCTDEETKYTPNPPFTQTNFVEISTSSELCLSSSTFDTSGSLTPLTTVTSNSLLVSSVVSVPTVNHVIGNTNPIQIQYFDGGICLQENGKSSCMETFNTEEVPLPSLKVETIETKIDPVKVPVSIHPVDEVSEVDTLVEPVQPTSLDLKINKPEGIRESFAQQFFETTVEVSAQVASNSAASDDSDNSRPLKVVRTYGKPKQVVGAANKTPEHKPTPVVIAPSLECSDNKKPSVNFKTSEKSDSRPAALVKLAHAHEKTSSRVSIPIVARKRRLIIDTLKQIPIPEFKRQLINTKDIVLSRSDLAPGSKQAMKCLEESGISQLFASPGRPILNHRLSRIYMNQLVVAAKTHDNSSRIVKTVMTPLTADLRIPKPLVNEAASMPVAHASRRLMNAGNPMPHIFKGLRKPPVFREYKRIQQKSIITHNGLSRKYSHKGTIIQPTPALEEACVKTQLENVNTATSVNIEEVVYTVGEGESVVLKSHTAYEDCSYTNPIQDVNGDEVAKLETRTNYQLIDNGETVKPEQEEYKEPMLSEGDMDDILYPNVENVQYSTSPTSVEFFNGSPHLDVKSSDSKSLDLQNDDDLKLWTFQVSSS